MANQTPATTRTRTTAQARPTPAPKAERESDVKVLDYSADGSTFTARLFGEKDFVFTTDYNVYLYSGMATGDIKAARDLIHALLEVTEVDGEDIDVTRRKVKLEFDELVGSQRNFTWERMFGLINDLVEAAAGNEPSSSSDD